MSNPDEIDNLPYEEQSNIIIPTEDSAKNKGESQSSKQDSNESKTEKKDKKTSRKNKTESNESNSSNKKPESDEKTENSSSQKTVISEDNIPLSEIIKQNQFKKFMKEAEKKSEELRSKIVSQLSEVFKIFDIDHDGIISESDLRFTFTSFGESISDEKIKKMINESSKPIDFEAFVSLFEDKEMEFDSQFDLIKAFSKWDKKFNGYMVEESFKNDLQTWGDKFTERDADRALEEARLYEEDGKSTIDYVEFCANLCGLQNVKESDMFQEKYLRNSKKL